LFVKRRRLWIGLGIVAVVALLCAGPFIVTFHDTSQPELKTPAPDAASAAVDRFLDGYVDPDGRAVRRDEGNDTTSQVQAYGLLAAVATGDRQRFDALWTWAKGHLVQPNGLMASEWKNGAVVDAASTPAADLDAARALAVAGKKFGNATYTDSAKTMANAITAREVMSTPDNGHLLAAGALSYRIDIGDHSPRAERELATLTNSPVWTDIATATIDRVGGGWGRQAAAESRRRENGCRRRDSDRTGVVFRRCGCGAGSSGGEL
jgi:hypothetical protein